MSTLTVSRITFYSFVLMAVIGAYKLEIPYLAGIVFPVLFAIRYGVELAIRSANEKDEHKPEAKS